MHLRGKLPGPHGSLTRFAGMHGDLLLGIERERGSMAAAHWDNLGKLGYLRIALPIVQRRMDVIVSSFRGPVVLEKSHCTCLIVESRHSECSKSLTVAQT